MAKHPIQTLEVDADRVLRFRANPLVRHLLDFATPRGCGMNALAHVACSAEDAQQFAQLIGYSLSGYGELPYVDDYAYNVAEAMYLSGEPENDMRIAVLENELTELRAALREPMAKLFGKHPDDLGDA